MKYALTIFLTAWSYCIFAQGLEIRVDGAVAFDNSSFSINEAGSDFSGSVISEPTLFISVSSGNYWDKKDNPNQKWRIEIQKSDIAWDDDLVLEAKRDGKGYKLSKKGNKKPNIQGGTSYQPVTGMGEYFFRGKDQVVEIPVSFKLTGFSIVHGAKDYETNIILTVYDD